MKVTKFHSDGEPTEKVTMRVQLHTARELEFLEALFLNNYKLTELANSNMVATVPFSSEEVKLIGDAFYIAIVTNRH